MNTERVILIVDKKNDKLINECNINSIDLYKLYEIIQPPENDPLLYKTYKIKKSHVKRLEELVKIKFDLKKYSYQIDCFQM